MSDQQAKYWAVVPAAGVGSRMQADRPKQYLPLCGKTVIEHTLGRLASHPLIEGVVVAVSDHDAYWSALNLSVYPNVFIAAGGKERCHSVANALEVLAGLANERDWVLVHDAARPCLHVDDIQLLITELADNPVGGLLGLPVADTVKRTDSNGRVQETVNRVNLWRALTPQMFRLGQLRDALQRATNDGFIVTDEASAMEYVGLTPQMVAGRADNLKITLPADLKLAQMYLQQQELAVCA